MAYMIYHPTTYQPYYPNHSVFGPGTYETERAAKAQLTKAVKAGKIDSTWLTIECKAYYDNEPLVETHNMLNPSAGKIMIRLTQKGGCCDPATEAYHSM